MQGNGVEGSAWRDVVFGFGSLMQSAARLSLSWVGGNDGSKSLDLNKRAAVVAASAVAGKTKDGGRRTSSRSSLVSRSQRPADRAVASALGHKCNRSVSQPVSHARYVNVTQAAAFFRWKRVVKRIDRRRRRRFRWWLLRFVLATVKHSSRTFELHKSY